MNVQDATALRELIKDHLSEISSAEGVFGLFRLLNYPSEVVFDVSYERSKEDFGFSKDDFENIRKIFSVVSFENQLEVFFLEVSSTKASKIRTIANTFSRRFRRCLLIFSCDYSQVVFVLPTREKTAAGKRLLLIKLVVTRDEIRYTDANVLSNIGYDGRSTPGELWKKWQDAFSVERVTGAFFEDYKTSFFDLRQHFFEQGVSKKQSHDFTLQFLNRIMFVYFISKLKWLIYPNFIGWLWHSYKKEGLYGSNLFYEKWLKQVFFKALNNRLNEITDLPDEVVRTLASFPFLNGGLFTQNDLDQLEVEIEDQKLKHILENFFEKYNFTIKEDMPLEAEVAVDPQMLGYVYESLAKVAEEIYDKDDLGIFYTPRVEVDFMCRRALVEYLSKHLPDIEKDKLYHLVFDPPEEKNRIEQIFATEGLWQQVKSALDNLSVVDPACGSGAFLVGMLSVLAEIYRIANTNLGIKWPEFNLKNRIIAYSLYGVDLMPWAIQAAELRLWLQLIVETSIGIEELKKHPGPLLPNLNLNLRVGDSLIQEVGGISISVRTNDLPQPLRIELDTLKKEKRMYFEHSPTAKFEALEDWRNEEIRLFGLIINDKIDSLNDEVKGLQAVFLKKKHKQSGLFGPPKVVIQTELNRDKEKAEITKQIRKSEAEIAKLAQIKGILGKPGKKPFVWDIDFCEIFGDKNGFDIVIGNPPYVRQEDISPPAKTETDVTQEEYKDKLGDSIKNQFPFANKPDKRSDYYVYFYFHGLSLLNEKGTFCFITSNSWLDVGYGRALQEFLLKFVPIHAIYDNPEKSFEHADINTIIALFGAPAYASEQDVLKASENREWTMLDHVAKFVMFRKPFKEVLNAQNLIDIDGIQPKDERRSIVELVHNVVATNDYRVFPLTQRDLLLEGWDYPDDHVDAKSKFGKGEYKGDKWGAKYLQAPEIFYTILEKGAQKLLRLDAAVDMVTRGFTTGDNDFFYLDRSRQEKWQIEEEFLAPVVRSPKECRKPIIDLNDLKYQVFVCQKSKSELRGTNALKYVEWGERQRKEVKSGVEKGETQTTDQRRTTRARSRWYSLPEKPSADVLFPGFYHKRFVFPINPRGYVTNDTIYYLHVKDPADIRKLGLALNSTLSILITELFGRKNLGGGALKTIGPEIKPLLVLDPARINEEDLEAFDAISKRETLSIFEEVGIDPYKPIEDQTPRPIQDRAELDRVVFDELDLSEIERRDVYRTVCKLVKQRLAKAQTAKET